MLLRWGIGGAFFVALAGFFWARQRKLGVVVAMRIALIGLVGGLFGYVVVVALGRFWLTGWLYRVVGYEYMAVVVTLVVGIAALIPATLFYSLQKRRHQYVEDQS